MQTSAASELADLVFEDIFRQRKLTYFEQWYFEQYYMTLINSHHEGHPSFMGYLRNLAFVIADIDTPEKIIVKGTQLGITHLCSGFSIYSVTERGRSVGYWVVRNEDANYLSSTVVKESLKHMPFAASQLMVDDVEAKNAKNTNRQRVFKRGNIFTRSSESAAAYDTLPIADAIQDEYSRQPQMVKVTKDASGETPHGAVKSRMDGRKDSNHVALSSPEELGVCGITKLYEKTEVQLEERIACLHCSNMIALTWGDEKQSHGMVWDRVENKHGDRDNVATARSAKYKCPCCHELMSHDEVCNQDNLTGQLWSEDGRVFLSIEDRCYYQLPEDDSLPQKQAIAQKIKIEKPHSVGIRLNSMLSRSKTYFDATLQYLEAIDMAKQGDESYMRTFVKKYLAKAFHREDSNEVVRHEAVMAKYEDYAKTEPNHDPSIPVECPEAVQLIVWWWDLQNDYIQGLAVGFGYGDEMWVLKSVTAMGDPQTSDSMEQIKVWHNYQFTKPSGNKISATRSGIDSGDRPNLAYRFSRMNGRLRYIPTKGHSISGKPYHEFPGKPKKNCARTFMTMLGTDTLKDLFFGRMKVNVAGPGYVHIPEPTEWNEINKEWCEQVTAEQLKLKNGEYKYVPVRDRNEALDCLAGCIAMCEISKMPMFRFKYTKPEVIEGEFTEIKENQLLSKDTPEPELPVKQKQRKNMQQLASSWHG